VNPEFVAEVERVAVAMPSEAGRLRKIEAYPTAIWLDSIAKAGTVARHLDAAAAQQASAGGTPFLTVFVLYDLPNRDCAASASAGELTVEGHGESRYRTEFVDPIAAQFRSHPAVRVAAILEPDSLANIATNLDRPKCAASGDAYQRSLAYAIRALSLPNVSLYLDAAHAGWLGWEANRLKLAHLFAQVLALAGKNGAVRGFATNVSNYNSLVGGDGGRLEPSDPCPDELTYVQRLTESLAAAGVSARGAIIDTSRNGRDGIRSKWGSWCNVHGAGLGERPRPSPAPGVDAYYWIKPPGESDGTSNPSAPRYDPNCSSPDSTPGASQAGSMFPGYLAQLAARARPPL
jgi:cellulose 1,4-beta-cellobiosidase